MARINIEDTLFGDERFLIACDKIGRFSAMGQIVYIMKLAQKYWADGKQLIPKKTYELSSFNSVFLDVGLVTEIVENGEKFHYLSGSKEQFAWIESKRENGKKGGRPSKNNNLIKPTETERKANESYGNPLTLTLTPTLTLTHNKKNVDSCEFDFEDLYKQYPNKTGNKKLGMAKLKKTIKTMENYSKLKLAISNYLDQCKAMNHYLKGWGVFCNQWDNYLPENGWEMPTHRNKPFGSNTTNKSQIIQDQSIEFLREIENERLRGDQ